MRAPGGPADGLRAAVIALAVFSAVVALGTATSLVFGSLGLAAYVRSPPAPPPAMPGFRRDPLDTCNNGFFCLNASSPNPSYVQFNVPPLLPSSQNNYQFLQPATNPAFDISDPEVVLIKQAGVYLLTGFFALFSFTPFEAALIVMANTDPVLMAPAVAGDILTVPSFGLVGNLSLGVAKMATIAHFDAGTQLRVAYEVSADALITPGANFACVQLSAE
jgi:hypothetical protein